MANLKRAKKRSRTILAAWNEARLWPAWWYYWFQPCSNCSVLPQLGLVARNFRDGLRDYLECISRFCVWRTLASALDAESARQRSEAATFLPNNRLSDRDFYCGQWPDLSPVENVLSQHNFDSGRARVNSAYNQIEASVLGRHAGGIMFSIWLWICPLFLPMQKRSPRVREALVK